MLKLHGAFLDCAVLAIRTGGVVAYVDKPIINPDNLKIVGYFVRDRFSSEMLVLLSEDIREVSRRGLVVNDHEVLSEVEDLVKWHKIIEIDYQPIGKKVEDRNGKKYGKISDYAVETNGLFIKKIYAVQSVIKNLTGANTSIDRSQVYEITNSKIIIEAPTEKLPQKAKAAAIG